METTPSVYIKTLGCKVNTYDSHALAHQMREQGFCVQENADEKSAVTIINTCSVTANAEREARYLARRFKRENPDTMVVLTGCYAQTDSGSLAKLDEVDFIVPNEVKERAAELIAEAVRERMAPGKDRLFPKLPEITNAVHNNRQSHFKSSLTLFDHAESTRTRVFLKIQDGCNGFCSYCLIPYARGQSRSVPSEQVLAEVQRQIELGAREIVLTGIHVGDYGESVTHAKNATEPRDAEPRAIDELLRRIFAMPGSWRLRISSLEPSELRPELVAILAENKERFCAHFHLPLQSGCDRILKLMRRTYDSRGYADGVELIRKFFPHANIGADVIPGFPGETDDDFETTVEFIKSVGLNYLHVFPYSPRPNTAAIRMPHHVDPLVIKERAKTLRRISNEIQTAYYRSQIGRQSNVVWENQTDAEGRRKGHTAEMCNVVSSREISQKASTLHDVKLLGLVAPQTILVRSLSH